MTRLNPPALRAIIADDERLLREQLKARLSEAWPSLQVCGEARDGSEAVQLAEALRADVIFLDIRMPGLTGIEAAREILALPGWSGEVVFVTAYDEYAVAAFEQGALDYLLKPVEAERMARCVTRLQERLARKSQDSTAAAVDDAALDALFARLHSAQAAAQHGRTAVEPLRWIQASSGATMRLIPVDEVLFFRSDDKYTRVQTRDREALIRTPIRDLLVQLDGQRFWQIHRSTIVNLGAVSTVVRDDTGKQRVHLKDHPEVLEVSRGFAHLFRAAP